MQVKDVAELKPESLYRRCNPEVFPFETTKDLEDLTEFIGQPRALEALRFGVGIESEGFNVFALGNPGTGKHTFVRQFLESRAETEQVPPDICYVNNFEEPHRPKILRLKAGGGKELFQDMEKLVEELRNALRAAFENEEYQNRQRTVAQEIQEQQQHAFEDLQKKADEKSLSVLRTPAGLAFAPVRDGEVVPPDEFKKLPEEEQERIKHDAEELQQESQKIFQKIPVWEREMREKLKDLNREVTSFTVVPLINELRKKYEDAPDVATYLNVVEKDTIDNAQALLQSQGAQEPGQRLLPSGVGPQAAGGPASESPQLRQYRVNVLVDHSESKGAPVVYEDNPNLQNLVGRVEHLASMGMLLTDFNMIRSGALHRANGGYLVMDALKLLLQPFAWDALKRLLKSREIKIESLSQMYGFISTVSLEPEPVPLDVKVTLLGSPMIYYLLRYHDPEFGQLFKVAADFDMEVDRTEQNVGLYGRLIGTVARKEGLRHFDRDAVARIVERGARIAGDGEKLSVHMQAITDLLRESNYWAGQNGNGIVGASDVQRAIDAWIYRSDRIRERMQEQIQRGIILIDTEGRKVGQVNGLSVIQLGEFAFGRPSRITARVRMGKGEVVDIEREVEMGGPIHSKGVLILAGFLGERYATDQPLSLSASLVFEQSYSGVEGDSASSAELYSLLSAIAKAPIDQSLAVTGSVNQHGQIQPIGGVNEKIEGFFDTCKQKGLNGDQGVLIPASNVRHLMLRQDVIDAAKEGRFHIYAVESIDQGIEILTGVPAGEPDAEGNYPPDSINGKVCARLKEFAEKQKKFSQSPEGERRAT
ncbi:MAG: AAA family ATPase [Deltaproteobacteria bacterium]|nr:AAA family ATPase [Deltaproteobacteria bacterium]